MLTDKGPNCYLKRAGWAYIFLVKVYFSNKLGRLASRPKTAIGAIWVFADKDSVEKHIDGSNADIHEVEMQDDEARRMLSDMAMLMTNNIFKN